MKLVSLKSKAAETLLGQPLLVKVMGIAVGMTVFLSTVMAWQIQHSYFRLERKELEEQARFVADVVAAGSSHLVRNAQTPEVQQLLNATMRISPATGTSIEEIEVKAPDGQPIAQARRAPSPGSSRAGGQFFHGSSTLPGTVPGSVAVALSDGHINYELGWHTRRIILTTCVIAGVGFLVGWLLMRLVTRPISELVGATRLVGAGDSGARAPVRAKDEVGELAVAFNEMMEALQQKEALNQQLMRRLLSAEEAQRKRMASELQNRAGQALASIIVGLTAVEDGANRECLTETRALAAKTLGELHDLSLRLGPGTLEDLGLMAALQKFCRTVAERFGIKVGCTAIGLEGTGWLANEIEVALFRIVEEALVNAVQHGQSRSIDVLLQRKEQAILAVIEDDGRGFDASDWREECLREERLGLLSIEERAALLGGSLKVESRPGAGTSLFVEIPIPPAAHG